MSRVSSLTLVFAVLSLVFFVALIALRIPFPLEPLMSYQDALDILTPVILIPLYWLIFRKAASGEPSRAEEIAFVTLAAVWVLGHGMHLAANAISNGLQGELLQPTSVPADAVALVHFFDEVLSHWLWHVGIVGLAWLLIYAEWRRPAGLATVWWMAILAGVVYGFTLFSIFVEAQTVALGLPFAASVVVFGLAWARATLRQRPVLAFMATSCTVALVLLLGWGLYWGGFPEFSDVGLI